MRSWGYGLYCSAQVVKAQDADREEGEREEVRAACWPMERLGTVNIWPPDALAAQLQQGIDWLTWLRDDPKWHEGWDEPGDLRASLNAQSLTLVQMLANIKPGAGAQEQPH